MVVRQYNDELKYLERVSPNCWKIKKGFQPNMKVITCILFFLICCIFLFDFQLIYIHCFHTVEHCVLFYRALSLSICHKCKSLLLGNYQLYKDIEMKLWEYIAVKPYHYFVIQLLEILENCRGSHPPFPSAPLFET